MLKNKFKKLTASEKAWLAGFFDGEGCVHVAQKPKSGRKRKISHPRLLIKIGQKFPGILRHIINLLGYGEVRKAYGKNRDAYYITFLSKDEIAQFTKTILPYSITKKDQLVAAIEFLKNVSDKPNGSRFLTNSQKTERERLGQLITELKSVEPVCEN